MADSKNIVIIGAGFAGLAAAKALATMDARVILIDQRNYHLFQPLLYQVATAALSPAQIAQPIRAIVRRQKNCTVALGTVTSIDTEKRVVKGAKGELPYDYLIVATGATHAYFGHDEWQNVAPGLKSIEDATSIRQKILSAFERAEIADNERDKQANITFVIVGGGPTGVEMAGAIAELAKVSLKNDFRLVDPQKTRVILAEASPRILGSFPEKLSARAKRDLEKLGVEVLTGKPVSECNDDSVVIDGQRIPTKTIIWAAGVKASPAAQWLGAEQDRAGRVIVTSDLTLPGHPNIFVVGDTAAITTSEGAPVPGLAPAAVQAGHYAASVIRARETNSTTPRPFAYRHRGTMATIGRGKAVADIMSLRFSGLVAWLIWGVIHLMPLVGFRNRAVVASDWLWAYFTKARGVRLITSSENKSDSQI